MTTSFLRVTPAEKEGEVEGEQWRSATVRGRPRLLADRAAELVVWYSGGWRDSQSKVGRRPSSFGGDEEGRGEGGGLRLPSGVLSFASSVSFMPSTHSVTMT